jgi:hypothetical protein
MTAEALVGVVTSVLGTAFTMGTILYLAGKQSGRFDGHEKMDLQRFTEINKDLAEFKSDMKLDMTGMRDDIKQLLTRPSLPKRPRTRTRK